MKTELELAKEEIARLKAIIQNITTLNNNYSESKKKDDYEFNLHQHWVNDNKEDDYESTIKHFRD